MAVSKSQGSMTVNPKIFVYITASKIYKNIIKCKRGNYHALISTALVFSLVMPTAILLVLEVLVSIKKLKILKPIIFGKQLLILHNNKNEF